MFFDDKPTQIEKAAKKGNSEKLVSFLGDSKPEIRILAIKALGSIADDKAVNALIGCLSDSEPTVRLAAINVVGSMRNQTLKSHLQHIILTEKDESVKTALQAAIANIPNTNYGTRQ